MSHGLIMPGLQKAVRGNEIVVDSLCTRTMRFGVPGRQSRARAFLHHALGFELDVDSPPPMPSGIALELVEASSS